MARRRWRQHHRHTQGLSARPNSEHESEGTVRCRRRCGTGRVRAGPGRYGGAWSGTPPPTWGAGIVGGGGLTCLTEAQHSEIGQVLDRIISTSDPCLAHSEHNVVGNVPPCSTNTATASRWARSPTAHGAPRARRRARPSALVSQRAMVSSFFGRCRSTMGASPARSGRQSPCSPLDHWPRGKQGRRRCGSHRAVTDAEPDQHRRLVAAAGDRVRAGCGDGA